MMMVIMIHHTLTLPVATARHYHIQKTVTYNGWHNLALPYRYMATVLPPLYGGIEKNKEEIYVIDIIILCH